MQTEAVYFKQNVSVKMVKVGGCQHTAAAMYTLEDLLNTRGKFIKLKLKFKFVFIHTYSHLDKIFLKYKEKRDGTF